MVKLAKTIVESRCTLSIQMLKIHYMAKVTLLMKNLMGAVHGDRGRIMHHQLYEKLADLAGFLKPRLSVIDCTVGMEMDEIMGRPVEMDLVIAGTDMVATDAVGSAVMGVDPSEVGRIREATMRGLGISELKSVRIFGDNIRDVKRCFSSEFSDKKFRSYSLSRSLIEADMARMRHAFEGRN